MSDLSQDDIDTLVDLTRRNEAIRRRIEPNVVAIKANAKKIDALLGRVAKVMDKAGRKTKNRYGVSFRLVTKAGRVAWRDIVEKLKSKEYADTVAADAKPTQKVEYTLPPDVIPIATEKAKSSA